MTDSPWRRRYIIIASRPNTKTRERVMIENRIVMYDTLDEAEAKAKALANRFTTVQFKAEELK